MSSEAEVTCRLCKEKFLPSKNNDHACRYHPESFTGETAQRWLAPGDSEHKNDIHYFYTCCGSPVTAMGCCYTVHRSYDDSESVSQRRPGMGIAAVDTPAFNGFVSLSDSK